MRTRRTYLADRDDIAEQDCAKCGATLRYLGHIDGSIGSGVRFNVLLVGKC